MEYLFNDENTHLSISLGLTLAVVVGSIGVAVVGGVGEGVSLQHIPVSLLIMFSDISLT